MAADTQVGESPSYAEVTRTGKSHGPAPSGSLEDSWLEASQPHSGAPWPGSVGGCLANGGHRQGWEASLSASFPSSLTSTRPSWTTPTSDIPSVSVPVCLGITRQGGGVEVRLRLVYVASHLVQAWQAGDQRARPSALPKTPKLRRGPWNTHSHLLLQFFPPFPPAVPGLPALLPHPGLWIPAGCFSAQGTSCSQEGWAWARLGPPHNPASQGSRDPRWHLKGLHPVQNI